MNRKKILFLIQDLKHGGAERVLVNLVNNLDKTKYDVTLQTLFDTGINRQYINNDVNYIPGFKYEFRGNSYLIRLLPCRFLWNWIIKDKYDIVIAYLEGTSTRIVSGGRNSGTKCVAWVHIELNNICKCFNSYKNAILAWSGFKRIVCVSQKVKEAFEKAAKQKMNNICVLYNTNETEKILISSKEPITDIVFSNEVVNIISVAKIVHTKGYDRLVHVHKKLLLEGIKHHIYILGIGEQQKELQSYIDDNSLNCSFTFLGFRDNPYKYVAACDMYVCSSRREGFSTAVTEALIVGTPVVSTDCSGARELLGDNNEYGIVTENSEEGIYQGMKRMIVDSDLRRYYASKALERGRKFSREATVKAVEDMLDAL